MTDFSIENSDIDFFPQECHNLTYFNIDYVINEDLNIFFECFGQNNPLLEVLGLTAALESNNIITAASSKSYPLVVLCFVT